MRSFILAAVVAALAIAMASTGASADGNGSPGECLGGPSIAGDTYTAPDGFNVEGICIKSGQLHTGIITADQFGCYDINGLGTQTVTVSKDFDGPDCQDISHLDAILSACTVDCDPPDPCDPQTENCEPCDPQQEDCEPPTDPCELDPDSCIPVNQVCVDGAIVEAPADQATNDCDPVRLCVDGESITVTEFEAAQIEGAEDGSCTPSEEPPPSEPTPESTPITEVEEVLGVQEEAAVQEVAALPSAGYGPSNGTSLLWILSFGALLVGFGTSTLVTVRHRK